MTYLEAISYILHTALGEHFSRGFLQTRTAAVQAVHVAQIVQTTGRQPFLILQFFLFI